VRDEKDVFAEVPNPRVPKEMLELAKHILETKAGHFDPKRFKHDYELALRKLVKRKAAGEKIEALPPAQDTGKVINLMEALRRSVQSGHVPSDRAHESSKKRPARHSGHRRRSSSTIARGVM
jgi:non-homologous end joining protein Ku